jgi:hypothetical protein
MVVELAGLPGSGKTTIARHLATGDGRVRPLVLKPSLDPLLRQPGMTLRAIRWGLLRPSLAWPAWAKLCLLREGSDPQPVPGTILLLEEGIVHHTWRTLYRYPAARACPWARLLEAGPPLVVLRACRATRHARLPGKRVAGDTNRRLAAGQADEATWGTAERLFDEVVAAAARQRRVVDVSTEGGIGEAARRVSDVLATLR